MHFKYLLSRTCYEAVDFRNCKIKNQATGCYVIGTWGRDLTASEITSQRIDSNETWSFDV